MFFITKGYNSCLLLYETASSLSLINIHIKAISTTSLRQKFQGILGGIGKLKNFQLHLCTDEFVMPVVQKYPKVQFYLRA